MHDGNSDKKAKGAKKGVIKRELRFEYYTKCLLNNKIVLKLQQRFKSKAPHVYTEEIEKILRSSNDIKNCNLLKVLHQIHMVQVLKNNEKNAAKISTCKIIDFDDVTYDNNTKHNLKWLYIPCWVRN